MKPTATEICRKLDTDLICLYSAIDGNHHILQSDYQIINTLIASRRTDKKNVMLMLSSQGGDLIHTMKFVNVLRQHYSKITVYVPRIGKSSMTLLAMMSNIVYVRKTARLSDFSPLAEQSYTHGFMTLLLKTMLEMIQAGMLKDCDADERNEATGIIVQNYLFPPNKHGDTILGEKFVEDFKDHGHIQVFNEESFGLLKLNSLDQKLQNEFENNLGLKKIFSFNDEFIFA